MLTHKFSYIVFLGPYFGCWGSLFHKKWVLIGSLSQSLGVLISFGGNVIAYDIEQCCFHQCPIEELQDATLLPDRLIRTWAAELAQVSD